MKGILAGQRSVGEGVEDEAGKCNRVGVSLSGDDH